MLSGVFLPPLGSLVPIRKFEAEREAAQLICRDDFWAGMITKRSRVFRQDNDAKSAKHIVKYLVNRKRLVILKFRQKWATIRSRLITQGWWGSRSSSCGLEEEVENKLRQLEKYMREVMRTKDKEFHKDMPALKKEI
jgi:hypothetical protein